MTTASESRIGVAGCGRMGLPMARAMSAAGFDVRGFDVRAPGEFGAFSGEMSNDAAAFAEHPQILFSIVRDQTQTDDVLFGVQNFVANASALTHIVICSTLSPRYVKNLRARIPSHIRLVDAPMSGAIIAAQENRLSFMLGGDEGDLDNLQPLLDAMGTHFHRMGPFGAGMSGKVLNNLVCASSTIATRLVIDWASQMGLEQKALLDLMHTSSGQNWLASNFDAIEFAGHGYQTGNSIGILKKDVESAVDGAPDGADTSLAELLIDKLGKLDPL